MKLSMVLNKGVLCIFIFLFSLSATCVQAQNIQFKDHDVIVLAGGTNIGNMRTDGYLETLIMAANQGRRLHVWNLGWDGDTAYEQFRDVGFGKWSKNIDSLGADIVFVQFGQMESLQDEGEIAEFIAAYKKILSEIRKADRKIILLSPVPFEPENLSTRPSTVVINPLEKTAIEKYTEAIRVMAQESGDSFIDLYHDLKERAGSLTTDGIHLGITGQKIVAEMIMEKLRMRHTFSDQMEPLRNEILRKNQLWLGYWRPGNWAFLGGDRTTVPFSYGWQNTEKRIFPDEIRAFEPLIREAENKISEQQRLLVTTN